MPAARASSLPGGGDEVSQAWRGLYPMGNHFVRQPDKKSPPQLTWEGLLHVVGTRARALIGVDHVAAARVGLRWDNPPRAGDVHDVLGLVAADDRERPLLTLVENLVCHSATAYTVGRRVKFIDAYLLRMHSRRMATRIKRRKATRKEQMVPIRMTADQKATLAAAAERRGCRSQRGCSSPRSSAPCARPEVLPTSV